MDNESEKLYEIIQLGSQLNSVQDVDILLERILSETRMFVNADAGSIQTREKGELIFHYVQTDSLQRKLPPGEKLIYKSFRTKINKESIAGYVASTNEIVNIPDAYQIPDYAPFKFNSKYDQESNYLTKSMLTVPLKTNQNETIGVMQIVNKLDEKGNYIPFTEQDELYVLHFANNATMILQRAQLTRSLILRMINMAELRDPKETGAHVNRVASYSVELYERWARHKNVSKDEIDRNRDILRMSAMLHDVGKVAISDLILKKPARFTEEEYEIMKTHTIHGARLFDANHSEFDKMSAIVALTHHENWDGTGYPGNIDVLTGVPLEKDSKGNAIGLKGEEIPIFGRIVSLADVYDALSCKRVYKEAWKEEDVLNEIKKLNGIKFDPDLVDVFFESLPILKSIFSKYPDN